MVLRQEILVYAGASTTYLADQVYTKRAKACLDFEAAKRHPGLEDEEAREIATQNVKSQNTSISDRSDVVPDSQEKSYQKLLASVTTDSQDEAAKVTAPTLQEVFELSYRQFYAHEKLYTGSQANIPPTANSVNLVDQKATTTTPPQSVEDCTDLLEFSEYLPTPCILEKPAGVGRDQASSPVIAGVPAVSEQGDRSLGLVNVKTMSAREALEFRSRAAMANRLSTHAGLLSSARSPHVSGEASITGALLSDKSYERVQSNTKNARPKSFMYQHLFDDLMNTPSIERAGISSVTTDGPAQPVCTNYRITTAVDELQGKTETPVSDGHTSYPSSRTDRLPIEVDLSPIAVKLPTSRKRKDSHGFTMEYRGDSGSLDNLSGGRIKIRSNPNTNAHSADFSQFLIAQSEGPFYRPSFAIENRSDEPIHRVLEGMPANCQTPTASTAVVPFKAPSNANKKSRTSLCRSDSATGGSATKSPLYISEPFKPADKCFRIPITNVDSEPLLMPVYLANIKTPKRVRSAARELRPLERGYWRIDIARLALSVEEASHIWDTICNIIRIRELYWISLQYVQETIRIYCYGQCTLQVWVVLYAITRKIKRGIPWIDAAGKQVLFH